MSGKVNYCCVHCDREIPVTSTVVPFCFRCGKPVCDDCVITDQWEWEWCPECATLSALALLLQASRHVDGVIISAPRAPFAEEWAHGND